MANLPTETAPIELRATLSSAVDHLPVALSNTSVALKEASAETRIRKHALAEAALHSRHTQSIIFESK
jgi:hypothetical protein